MYTVSQKTPTQSFCDNFGERESILIILSLLHSQMNCRRVNKICHLASDMYHTTLRNLNVQLCNCYIHINQDNLYVR